MYSVILLCYLALVSTVTAVQPPRHVRRNSTAEVTSSSICSGSRARTSHQNSSSTHSRHSNITSRSATSTSSSKHGTTTKTASRFGSPRCHPIASGSLRTGGLSSQMGTQPPYPYGNRNMTSIRASSGLNAIPTGTASGYLFTGTRPNNTGGRPPYPVGSGNSSSNATPTISASSHLFTGTRPNHTSGGPPYPIGSGNSSSIWPSSGTQVLSTSSIYGATASTSSLNALSTANQSALAASVPLTLTATPLSPIISATVSTFSAVSSSLPSTPRLSGCGAVSVYYGQTQQDWVNNNMDVWLDQWVSKHVADIAANNYGFTGAFASYAVGNPDFSCRDDGSTSDCDFNPCDIATLNSLGSEVRQAYYVMESINRFHSYFMGMRQGFTVSAIASALSKDNWATTFYKDKDDKQVKALREILTATQAIIGICAAFAGLAGPIGREGIALIEEAKLTDSEAGVVAGAAGALFTSAVGSVFPLIGQQ